MRFAICLGMVVCFAGMAQGADTAAVTKLKWEIVNDTGRWDIASAVVISGAIVVIADGGAGADLTATTRPPLNVTARSVDTAHALWVDRPPISPDGAFLAIEGDHVIVLGSTNDSNHDLVTRGYRLSTGQVLWTNVWDFFGVNGPGDVIATNGRATIIGGSNAGQAGHIRSFDTETGAILWEDVLQKLGKSENAIMSVSDDATHVVVSGRSGQGAGPQDAILRSYDVASGRMLWERTFIGMGGSMAKIAGNRVFLAGSQFVSAHDLTTGAPLWQVSGTGGSGIDANAQQLVVISVSPSGSSLIQSMDQATGAVVWSRETIPQSLHTDFLYRVALTAQAAYVIGWDMNGAPNEKEMIVRAYSPTGTALFEDRSHFGLGTYAYDLAIDGGNLFVVGTAGNATQDSVVRAYDVSSIELPFRVNAPILSICRYFKRCMPIPIPIPTTLGPFRFGSFANFSLAPAAALRLRF